MRRQGDKGREGDRGRRGGRQAVGRSQDSGDSRSQDSCDSRSLRGRFDHRIIETFDSRIMETFDHRIMEMFDHRVMEARRGETRRDGWVGMDTRAFFLFFVKCVIQVASFKGAGHPSYIGDRLGGIVYAKH